MLRAVVFTIIGRENEFSLACSYEGIAKLSFHGHPIASAQLRTESLEEVTAVGITRPTNHLYRNGERQRGGVGNLYANEYLCFMKLRDKV